MKATLIVLAAIVAVAFAQIRPNISETFEGQGYTHIVTRNETIWGIGHWAIDEPSGRSVERWEFVVEHRHRNVHFLKRYDLGFEYTVRFQAQVPHEVCTKRAVKPPMPPNWAWLKDSRYRGKHHIDGTTFDMWLFHVAGIELEVAVSEHDASRPEYFYRRAPEEQRSYHFLSWHTMRPNSSWFDVPASCKNATTVVELEVDGDDTMVAGTVVAAAARRIVELPGTDANTLIVSSMRAAGISTPEGLWTLQTAGDDCVGGPSIGDVFFDGVPAVASAIYLGDNQFAECALSRCGIVPRRDFTGGCRRYH
jgi:hypothetical protein